MKLKDIKEGQKFIIPNQEGIWHIETHEIRKESVWYMKAGDTHKDVYNEEGMPIIGLTWDTKVKPIENGTTK